MSAVFLVFLSTFVVTLAHAAPPSHSQAVPKVVITQPTSASTYTTTQTQLTLRGTATPKGNRTITQVTWATNQGGSGTATGTTAWTFPLTLAIGTTQVTVTAVDSSNGTGNDVLTITVMSQPGPITLLWDYTGGGDAFQVERCTVPCGALAPVASVAIGDRTWIDNTVAPTLDYCYRLAAVTGGMLGPYSTTECSP